MGGLITSNTGSLVGPVQAYIGIGTTPSTMNHWNLSNGIGPTAGGCLFDNGTSLTCDHIIQTTPTDGTTNKYIHEFFGGTADYHCVGALGTYASAATTRGWCVLNGTGDTNQAGTATAVHFAGRYTSAAPTAVVGGAAGTASQACAVTGTDARLTISLTVGSAGATTGVLCTVTFGTPYAVAPGFPEMGSTNYASKQQLSRTFANTTTTTWTLSAAAALDPGTYVWYEPLI